MFQRVASALKAQGYNASVEYPGYVAVTINAQTVVNVGTAGGHWGYDISDEQGFGSGDGGYIAAEDAPVSEVVASTVEVLEGLV